MVPYRSFSSLCESKRWPRSGHPQVALKAPIEEAMDHVVDERIKTHIKVGMRVEDQAVEDILIVVEGLTFEVETEVRMELVCQMYTRVPKRIRRRPQLSRATACRHRRNQSIQRRLQMMLKERYASFALRRLTTSLSPLAIIRPVISALCA